MNTRPAIDESAGPVSLSAAFNQDSSCFSVGLDSGFCVFTADPCELRVSRDFNAGIFFAEMVGRSNIIALVGGGKQPKFPQNKVIIWDDNRQMAVMTLEFRSQVNHVSITKFRIVVALQNSVHMYTFASPPEKISVFETADNPLGLCCLGPKIVAFPGRTPGHVQIVEIASGNVSIIPAHSSPLRAMNLSSNEETLATASEIGTLVRVFSTSSCTRIGELRRGVDHAVIFSLAISPNGALLAVTSDKATLHIFDLPHPISNSQNKVVGNSRSNRYSSTSQNVQIEDGNNQKWGILGKIPLLPRVFSDVYSFASTHIEIDDEPQTALGIGGTIPIPGIPGGKARKGILGWKDDRTILVIGAGRDGRWEKFVLVEGEDGKRHCVRNGWKRYLGT